MLGTDQVCGSVWDGLANNGGVMVSTVHGTRQCEQTTRTIGDYVRSLFAKAKSAISGFVADLLPGDQGGYTLAPSFA